MKTKLILTLVSLATLLTSVFFVSCGQDNKSTGEAKPAETTAQQTEEPKPAEPAVDEGKGLGEIKHVEVSSPLDEQMIKRGQGIYDMKCSACHKLDDTKVVGPGWKGVTERRKPEWIMNFVTNVDMMLDKDPAAQKLLEECLTRMPNQNLSVGDARDILEFMRKNDGQK
jgi:cytochrome c